MEKENKTNILLLLVLVYSAVRCSLSGCHRLVLLLLLLVLFVLGVAGKAGRGAYVSVRWHAVGAQAVVVVVGLLLRLLLGLRRDRLADGGGGLDAHPLGERLVVEIASRDHLAQERVEHESAEHVLVDLAERLAHDERHEADLDVAIHRIVEVAVLAQVVEHRGHEVVEVALGERLGRQLLGRLLLHALHLGRLLHAPVLLLAQASLLLLESLLLDLLRVAHLLELALLLPQARQLLLLHDLDEALLDRLAHQHLQYRPHFDVKVEQLAKRMK